MLAEAIAGATRPGQTVVWKRGDNTAEDLTGATLTGKIQNNAGTTRSITGTLTPADGSDGVFEWEYSALDVGTAGTFSVQFTATFAEAPTVARTIISQWVVSDALA